MNDKLYDRCIRCGSEQEFHIYEGLVKCRFCGHTFAVTKFQSEQVRINKALEEGEAAQAALAQAEKERDEAQQRLNHVVAALDGIAESQVDEDAQLKALFKEVHADRQTEEAIRDLLHGMQADQRAGADELTRLMLIMSESQTDAGDKLKLIGEIAGKILKGQDDILSRVSMQAEIAKILQDMRLSDAERDRAAEDFVTWSQSVHAEDIARLEAIQRGSNYLVESQRTIDHKLEELRNTALQTQKAVEAFQKEYQTDKINELNNLYRQAENYQYDRRFDKAEEKYYEVIQKGGPDAAVYWRILLCHYCVEYQEDEDGKRIPTILNPDLSDPEEMSIRKELKRSVGTGKVFYQADLAEIDRILDKYRKLRHTVQYDVFISVKQETNGHYTEDSDVASELYYFIKNQGLRVFNSRITKIPLGQEYEPYIIAALMSARLLIVVGSSAKNMNSKWVRNEWKRFQWLQHHEKTVHGSRVLFCYLVGMRPDEIPRGLDSAQQHLMSGRIDSESRLLESLKTVFPEKIPSKVEPKKEELQKPVNKPNLNGGNDSSSSNDTDLIKKNRFLIATVVLLVIGLASLIWMNTSGDRKKADEVNHETTIQNQVGDMSQKTDEEPVSEQSDQNHTGAYEEDNLIDSSEDDTAQVVVETTNSKFGNAIPITIGETCNVSNSATIKLTKAERANVGWFTIHCLYKNTGSESVYLNYEMITETNKLYNNGDELPLEYSLTAVGLPAENVFHNIDVSNDNGWKNVMEVYPSEQREIVFDYMIPEDSIDDIGDVVLLFTISGETFYCQI